MTRRNLLLSQVLGAAVTFSAVALTELSAPAQQPQRWTHDVGVSARQPGFGTASLGTDGARFSGRLGQSPITSSAGTGGLNAGLEHCVEMYPIPTQAGRVGARVCAQVSPNGLTGTVTPGLQLPTGTQVGAYYRFNYNPLAGDPDAMTEQPLAATPVDPSTDERLMNLLRQRTAERIREQQIDDHLAAQIAANTYNPPAEYAGQVPAAAPAPPADLETETQPQSASSGMTEAQFRDELARLHDEFQRADEYHRQHPLNIPVPQEHQTPPIGDVPPAGVRPQLTYNDYAPRNGYDGQGSRIDSTRRRRDENGNHTALPQRPYSTAIDSSSSSDFWQSPTPAPQAPQRQNRVYNGYDNTSRPIGSGRSNIAQQAAAMQQWSNNQIAAMNSRRSTAASQSSGPVSSNTAYGSESGSAASSSSQQPTGFGYDQTGRRGSQIVYDDDAPRQNGRLVNDENATRASSTGSSVLDEPGQRPISSPVYDHRPGESGIVDPGTGFPDIAPRQSGQSAPTAALRW